MLVGVLALLLLGPRLIPESDADEIAYTEFTDQVRDGKVKEITYNNNTLEITGKLHDGTKFTTVRPGTGHLRGETSR